MRYKSKIQMVSSRPARLSPARKSPFLVVRHGRGTDCYRSCSVQKAWANPALHHKPKEIQSAGVGGGVGGCLVS